MSNKKGKGYMFKRNGIYYVRIKINKKSHTISLKTTDKEEAKKKRREYTQSMIPDDTVATLNHLKAQIETAKNRADPSKRIEIKDMFLKYLSTKQKGELQEGTICNYSSMTNSFVRWFKKSTYMCDVSKRDAFAFVAELKGRFTTERVFETVSCLNRIWATCMIFDQNIATNVWCANGMLKFIGWKKKDKTRSRRKMSDEEVERLLVASKGEFFEKYWNGEVAILFELGAFTALRLSDCRSLKWSEVEGDIIRRLPIKTAKEGDEAIIPIVNRLRETLDAWRKSGKSSDEYVLPILNSRSRFVVNKICRKVFRAAGIDICEIDENGRKKIRTGFHGLRGYALSQFLRYCGDISVVQTIAAHKHPDMTAWYAYAKEREVRRAFTAQPKATTLSAETNRLINFVKGENETADECIRRLIATTPKAIPVGGLIAVESA